MRVLPGKVVRSAVAGVPAKGRDTMGVIFALLIANGLRTEARIDGRNSTIDVALAAAAPVTIYNLGVIRVTAPPGGYTLDAVATLYDTIGEVGRGAQALHGATFVVDATFRRAEATLDDRAMELLTRFGLADKRAEYPDRVGVRIGAGNQRGRNVKNPVAGAEHGLGIDLISKPSPRRQVWDRSLERRC